MSNVETVEVSKTDIAWILGIWYDAYVKQAKPGPCSDYSDKLHDKLERAYLDEK